MDAKEYLHSDKMNTGDTIFDPGGNQEYTEEQLIRFAEMWANKQLLDMLDKLNKNINKEFLSKF